MIIKCKMCGGDLEFQPGATYGTCEYCGSTSTIPQADDEGKLNRYNRANHFRRQGEFDKAVAAYEKLLEQDDTDAEAHWGAVISRFGIEYVEDPATQKRIPTCHRVQVASILADADYLAAVEHAPDNASRELYKRQAAEIAEIQKGILAISANEKPYDVFICYKETDENGQRTRDSALAQDVYYGLTGEGYKVFFSRITLEDKLGREYEPYIFAALNSAKVMVVIGTKPEYFNAVWVKNEWSRYLALARNDRSRLLIPCYRGMDPYDLPDELSSLQSQDMGRIGFMQDLLRGIKKVLDAAQPKAETRVVERVVQSSAEAVAAPGVQSLLDRAYLFMEDSDFESAAEYLNRVLDIDPKYAPAYAAKVCVALKLCKEGALADMPFLYEDNLDWQKALRFATPQQKKVYEGYIAKVKERVAVQIRNYAYDCAMEMAVNPKADRSNLESKLNAYRSACTSSGGNHTDGSRRPNSKANETAFQNAVRTNEPGDMSEQALKTAADMFQQIKDDSAAACARQALALAEQARLKKIYLEAVTERKNHSWNSRGLEKAAKTFLSVAQYKDAKEQAQKCIEEAANCRSDLYNTATSAMKEAGEDSGKWQNARRLLAVNDLDDYRDVAQLRAQAAKRYNECVAAEKEAQEQRREQFRREAEAAAAKKKRNTILGILAAVIVVAVFVVVTQVIIPGNKYKEAERLRTVGKYAEAVAAFAELGSYSDAATQVGATYYAEGETKRAAKDWEGAVTAFTNAGSYSDAATQILATYYAEGEARRAAQNWEGAVTAFTNAGSYSDASTQIIETHYQHAQALNAAEDYAGALAIFTTINGYKDVDSLLTNDHNLAAAAAAAARDAKYAVGNYVTFGNYPQTEAGTDNTPIEWLVIARDGQKALLISRYALDCQQYNTSHTSVTWETCSLRKWLNGTFINKAFTTAEQSGIVTTAVDNGKSQGNSKWGTSDGNNTQDKVFLLSYAEANRYFKNDDARLCAPTDYAVKQGGFTINSYKVDGKATGYWWLRSPVSSSSSAAFVNYNGGLGYYYVDYSNNGVRPALWIDLESGIF